MRTEKMKMLYRKQSDDYRTQWQPITNIDELISPDSYLLSVINDDGSHNMPFRFVNDEVVTMVVNNHGKENRTGEARTVVQTITRVERNSGKELIYTRTRCNTCGEHIWSEWNETHKNIELGEVTSFDIYTESGNYSGVYTNGNVCENFSMVVIDNKATANIRGAVHSVSQFKYSLSIDGTYSYKVRTGQGNNDISWGEWVDIGAADTSDIQDNSITAKKLSIDVREKLEYKLIRLSSFSTAEVLNIGDIVYNNNPSSSTYRLLRKFKGNIDNVNTFETVPFVDGAIYTYNNKLFVYNGTELVNVSGELEDAVVADINSIKKDAILSGSLNVNPNTDSVTVAYRNINGTEASEINIPTATTEKAGVMSVEDKKRLEYQLIRLAGFSPDDVVNIGDIVYNNNPSSSTYRLLRKFKGIIDKVNTFETVPFVDGAIYTYNNKLFVYNGTELVNVSGELEDAVRLLQGAVGKNVTYYATYDTDVAVSGSYISESGSVVYGDNFGYTNPIQVSEGDVLTVQGLGSGLPYFVWTTQTGEILSVGDVCSTSKERKVMVLDSDGYVVLNIRRMESTTVGAPYFSATISKDLLMEDRLLNVIKAETGSSIKYFPKDYDISETGKYIAISGVILQNDLAGYTKPIRVNNGDILTVQGLGSNFPYYAWVDDAGSVLSVGETCNSVLERKVMSLNQDGYIALNVRIKESTNEAAPPFEAIISSKVLLRDAVKDLEDKVGDSLFSQKEYTNADIDKNDCYVAFYNAMMKKCADYGINDALIGGPAGYGLESWNGVETERGKSSVDIYGLIKILGLVYGDWRLVDMWGEYTNPALTIPIIRGEAIVNQEISSGLGRSEFSYILTDNYCILASKGGTHAGIAVNYSAACTCDALKGNVVIGYVNTNIDSDTDSKSRYRAFKYLMDIAVRRFENRNSDVADLEELLLGQNVLRAAAVIIPNTNPQLLHRLDFADSSYCKLYEYNPGKVDTMSTIKSLTTAVALDYINDLNTLVTIKGSDITDATGGTHPIFNTGDKLTVKDLIYANSVRSSNQASYALARIVGQAILQNEKL